MNTDLVEEVNYPDKAKVSISVLKENAKEFLRLVTNANVNARNCLLNLNYVLAKLNAFIWTRFVLVNYSNLSNNNEVEDISPLLSRIIPELDPVNLKIFKSIDNFIIFEISSESVSNLLKVNKQTLLRENSYHYKIVYYPRVIICEKCCGFGHSDTLCSKHVI